MGRTVGIQDQALQSVTHTVVHTVSNSGPTTWLSSNPQIVQLLSVMATLVVAALTIVFTNYNTGRQLKDARDKDREARTASEAQKAADRSLAAEERQKEISQKHAALSLVIRRASRHPLDLHSEAQLRGENIQDSLARFDGALDFAKRYLARAETDMDIITPRAVYVLDSAILQISAIEDAQRRLDQSLRSGSSNKPRLVKNYSEYFRICGERLEQLADFNDGLRNEDVEIRVMPLSQNNF